VVDSVPKEPQRVASAEEEVQRVRFVLESEVPSQNL
jgi:hypothetical protein